MKKTNLILLITLLLLTFSCKKIEPPIDPTEANDPIYLLEGIMNGDSINLYVNDTTVFISDAPYNMNGIEAYSSTISNLETGFELKLIVLKPEVFITETGIQLIKEANTRYIVHQPICKSFDFSNSSNQADYLKIITNGEGFSGNQIEVDKYGRYNIDFQFSNLNPQVHTIPVEIGFEDEILNPYFDVTSLNNKIVLESKNIYVSSIWLLDGNEISTNSDHETTLSNGIHTITHKVTDSYNNTASYTTLVNYFDVLIWQMSQSYCSTDVIENNYGSVLIQAIHQGETYTSAYNSANLLNEFQITNIEYLLDPSTQTVNYVKLNVNFDVELKTINNSKILNLTNMKGTFHIKFN